MKKSVAIFVVLLFSSLNALSQNTTTLTGTVRDGDTQVWANASWTATIQIPGGGGTAKFLDGTSVPPLYKGTLNSSGAFPATTPVVGNVAKIVPTGVTWRYCFQSVTSATPSCFNQATQGTTFNMGTFASGVITAPRIQAGILVYAYNTNEILNSANGNGYVNTISGLQYYFFNGAYVQMSNTPLTPSAIQIALQAAPGCNTDNLHWYSPYSGTCTTETSDAISALIQSQTNCNVSGNVWQPQNKVCVPLPSSSGAFLLSPPSANNPQTVNNTCVTNGDPMTRFQITKTSTTTYFEEDCVDNGNSVQFTWGQTGNPNNSVWNLWANSIREYGFTGLTDLYNRTAYYGGQYVHVGSNDPSNPYRQFGDVVTLDAYQNFGGNRITSSVGLQTAAVDYNLNTDSQNIVYAVDATAGNRTITLPALMLTSPNVPFGRVYVVKKTDSTANTVILTSASGNIEGNSTYTLTNQNQVVWIQSNGTNWQIIAAYGGNAGSSSITDVSGSRTVGTPIQNTSGNLLNANGSLAEGSGGSTGTISVIISSSNTMSPYFSCWDMVYTATVASASAGWNCNDIPVSWYYQVSRTGDVTTTVKTWVENAHP